MAERANAQNCLSIEGYEPATDTHITHHGEPSCKSFCEKKKAPDFSGAEWAGLETCCWRTGSLPRFLAVLTQRACVQARVLPRRHSNSSYP